MYLNLIIYLFHNLSRFIIKTNKKMYVQLETNIVSL